MKPPKLMLLHPDDNVAVCIAPVAAGEPLQAGRSGFLAAQPIAVGHKIACQAIAVGEQVRKYGAPIGTATQAVAPGEWVHVHNLKSDYISTHDRRTATGAAK